MTKLASNTPVVLLLIITVNCNAASRLFRGCLVMPNELTLTGQQNDWSAEAEVGGSAKPTSGKK